MRSSEDTRDFALWSTRNVTIGRERVGMYTMNATRSINDLRVRNNLATPRGAELRTQKGSEIIACMCNSERPAVENSSRQTYVPMRFLCSILQNLKRSANIPVMSPQPERKDKRTIILTTVVICTA